MFEFKSYHDFDLIDKGLTVEISNFDGISPGNQLIDLIVIYPL